MADRPIIFSAPMILALLAGRKTMTRRVLNPQPFSSGYYSDEIDLTEYMVRGLPAWRFSAEAVGGGAIIEEAAAVHYARGDRLWVKEAWRVTASLDGFSGKEIGRQALDAGYRRAWAPIRFESDKSWRDWGLDPSATPGRYRHARFMTRWASRLTLIVESVKVERLQNISNADAIAEGASSRPCAGYRNADDGWSMDWSPVGALSRWAVIPPGGPSKAPLSERDIALGTPKTAFANFWVGLHGPGEWQRNPYVAAITFRVIRANIDTLDAAGAPRREEPAHV